MDCGERSRQHRVMTEEPMPPLGVRLTVDVQAREGARGTTYYARVRWTHPVTHHREGVKRTHGSLQEARAWVERLEGAAPNGCRPRSAPRRLCRPAGRSVGPRYRSHVDAGSVLGGTAQTRAARARAPPGVDDVGRVDRSGHRPMESGVRSFHG